MFHNAPRVPTAFPMVDFSSPEIGVHVISCYFLVLVWKCLILILNLIEEDFDVLEFDSKVEIRKNFIISFDRLVNLNVSHLRHFKTGF
jgi:hypothetical protein